MLHLVHNCVCIPHFICRRVFHHLCSVPGGLKDTCKDWVWSVSPASWLSHSQENCIWRHKLIRSSMFRNVLFNAWAFRVWPVKVTGRPVADRDGCKIPAHGFSSVTAFLAHYADPTLHQHDITAHRLPDRWLLRFLHRSRTTGRVPVWGHGATEEAQTESSCRYVSPSGPKT